MTIKQIATKNIILDTKNFRITPQSNQKDTILAIISVQGIKLVRLARDIIENGLNPSDLPIVIKNPQNSRQYIVVEGNRRLTVLKLMQDPELAKNTEVYSSFVRLSRSGFIPIKMNCALADNREKAFIWIDRKHGNGLKGAGTEPWTSIAKARADVLKGIERHDLKIVDFVLSNSNITQALKNHLEGDSFNITNLKKLVDTKELKEHLKLSFENDKIIATDDRDWLLRVLTKVLSRIANLSDDGDLIIKGEEGHFTERDINSSEKRAIFFTQIISQVSGRKDAKEKWGLDIEPIKEPTPVITPPTPKPPKVTPSLQQQTTLIPRDFSLNIPSGKRNDIYHELKKMPVKDYPNAVAVLFRVFVELSLDAYFVEYSLPIEKGKDGKEKILGWKKKLETVAKDAFEKNIITSKQAQPIHVVTSNPLHWLSTDTLNDYLHSSVMNPDPIVLKTTWANFQPFIQNISEKNKIANENEDQFELQES